VHHAKGQDPYKIVMLADQHIVTCYRFSPGQKYPSFSLVNGPASGHR